MSNDREQREWRMNGRYHRVNGPALISYNGTKYWYLNGELHRADGPAIEYFNGLKSWWLNGIIYSSPEEWFQALTPEQQNNYLWNLNK